MFSKEVYIDEIKNKNVMIYSFMVQEKLHKLFTRYVEIME